MKKPLRTPLFQQVADILRPEIAALPPGARLETDQGLSRRFSVSVSVIREAISLLRRDGLLERYVGRGTFAVAPVTAKIPNSSKPIAILCELDLLQAKGTSLLKRVQQSKVFLEERGFETAIYLGDHLPSHTPPTQFTCRQFLKDLERDRFGGVLAVWAFPHEGWVTKLREKKIPLVGIGLLHEKMVSYDYEAFIRLALKTLKARNRTKLAYINGISEWNLDDYDRERRRLVMNLFREAGIEVHNKWFKQDWHRLTPGAGWSQFREVWTGHPDRPDGLIIGSPALWPEVRSAMEALRLQTPRDLDVVVPYENAIPGGGSIQIPFNLNIMLSEAVDLLIDLVNGKTPVETRRFVKAWEEPAPVIAPTPAL